MSLPACPRLPDKPADDEALGRHANEGFRFWVHGNGGKKQDFDTCSNLLSTFLPVLIPHHIQGGVFVCVRSLITPSHARSPAGSHMSKTGEEKKTSGWRNNLSPLRVNGMVWELNDETNTATSDLNRSKQTTNPDIRRVRRKPVISSCVLCTDPAKRPRFAVNIDDSETLSIVFTADAMSNAASRSPR